MKKANKFKHLMANEVGLTIKLTDDGKLNNSIGFCFSEDIDPQRASSMIEMMHGVVSMIEQNPLLLMNMGHVFVQENITGSDLMETVEFEPDPELLNGLDKNKVSAKIVDISSRKKQ